MKKLYTIGMGLSFALMASQAFAQVNKVPGNDKVFTKPTATLSDQATKSNLDIRKDDPVVYWSEDFSNGLEGQNGAWTTGGDQGSLWFQTFPIGAENGYDKLAPLDNPAYNNTLPNLWGTRDVVASPTRDNGVMMLDVDRYNSDNADPDSVGSSHVIQGNPISSMLISPTIDLSQAGENVLLTFYQYVRQCCGPTYSATAELSTDNGATWIPYDVFAPYGGGNSEINVYVSLNISEALATATTDLTQCKVRFVWGGDAFVYFWTLDDVQFVQLPDNDLSLGKTYYNDFDRKNPMFLNDEISVEDYYKAFEYNNQPDYLTRPFTLGGIVSNVGAATQTNVVLHVDATLPDGSVVEDYAVTEPIDMEAGAVDTIFAAEIMPDVTVTGQYTFSYRVTGDAEDMVPGNNVGDDQRATLTREIDNNGYAIMSNDARTTGNSAYTTLGQDIIWGVPYVFPEATDGNPKYITHVEAVLFYAEDFAETKVGELIYFNVRKGAAINEEPTDPETLTSVYFDAEQPYKYDDVEIEHEIQESDIWYTDESNTPVWVSFELPSPVLVDANTIYQAEFRVPASGDAIVFSTIAQLQEQFAAVLYDNGDDPPAWSYLGSSASQKYNSLAIRFRTSADPTAVETISQENGMQLVQNYPNPFTTSTMIQYRIEETTQASLEVRDITGKLVFNKDLGMVVGATANTYELQRGSLTPGMYTYSIVTPANTITRKLIVQ